MPVVLFDLDGTLIDTAALYAECYRRAFTSVLPEPPTPEEMWKRKPASERRFLVDWYGQELGDRLHASMCEAYEALASELHGPLYEGVEPMLAELQARGVRLGAVTGKSKRAFAATVQRVPLAHYFEIVVFEDDVGLPKPDPEGIERALRAMGVDAEGAIYVGDTPMDLEAARRASMIPAAALWARTAGERARMIAKFDPDVWPLEHPMELLARLS